MTIAISRREFLKASAAAGGGLALEFSFPAPRSRRRRPPPRPPKSPPGSSSTPTIASTIRIARSEMGQGSLTGLAQLVAEELECDWNKVGTEFASPNEHVKRKRIWGSMSTGGSAGIRTSQEYLRKAGAGAREMLVSAAAAQWNVPASECTRRQGRHHPRAVEARA